MLNFDCDCETMDSLHSTASMQGFFAPKTETAKTPSVEAIAELVGEIGRKMDELADLVERYGLMDYDNTLPSELPRGDD